MSRRATAPVPLTCVVCGDEIVIAAEFRLGGAVCADCGVGPEDLPAPTNTPPQPVPPRARLTKPLPAPAPALNPDQFTLNPGASNTILEIEEWIYFGRDGDLTPLTSPRDFHGPNVVWARNQLLDHHGLLLRAFVVVLEWTDASDRPFRDIGPAFWFETVTARSSALQAAGEFARSEARRIRAVGPIGYRLARELELEA